MTKYSELYYLIEEAEALLDERLPDEDRMEWLLDKLPPHVMISGIRQKFTLVRMLEHKASGEQFYDQWHARFGRNYNGEADTAIKALLKLIIKLGEEKLL